MGDFSTSLEMTNQCTIHNSQCTIAVEKRMRGAFLCLVEIAASPLRAPRNDIGAFRAPRNDFFSPPLFFPT
ncbi:MAG: hypothetical protein LBL66_01535 [Clostridiales bacterium]|nr:hypothetical protein [Clostridiales bacterium]